ncbi:MAG: 50S ribosomal protein L25 [Phycisphaerales bacterium JB040]
MSETHTLHAEKRDKVGSRYSQRLRASGKLPAVIYGHKEAPVSVSLDAKETISHITRGEKLFALELEGKTEHVFLKDLGYDHLGTNIIHADLTRVDLNERVDTRAHIRLVGEPKGLKTAGAVLTNPTHEIELNCLVTNLPEEIEVDVSHLEAGDSVVASEVKLPLASMEMLTDPDTVIARVVIVAEVETDEQTEVAGATEPELVDARGEDEDEDEDKE